MTRSKYLVLIALISCGVMRAAAEVRLTSPLPGATVPSQVHFVATARSDYGYPTSSIIVTVDGVDRFLTYTASLDTTLTLAPGWRQIMIKSWDDNGNIVQAGEYGVFVSSSAPPPPTPTPTPTPVPPGTKLVSNIEKLSGWQSCDSCAGAGGAGPTAPYGMNQGISSPSRDGSSTQFWMAGSTPYTDVLWWKNIVSWDNEVLNRKSHHFVLDLYFYLDNPNAAEGIEWDVDQYIDGRGYTFGSQCSYRSDGTWDVWDNVAGTWVSTGVKCPTPAARVWNHVVLEFERTTDQRLHYVSYTMNGDKHYLGWYFDSVPSDWSGIDVNYQMDGNYRQEHYSTWVNNMSLKYW